MVFVRPARLHLVKNALMDARNRLVVTTEATTRKYHIPEG
jgi:hypothetical protein